MITIGPGARIASVGGGIDQVKGDKPYVPRMNHKRRILRIVGQDLKF